jgi:DNA-binding MarR family transcriptional regulator
MVDALGALSADLELIRRHTKGASLASLLEVVAAHEGIRPSVIADHLQVDRSFVGRRVRDCEQAGFVSVAADPGDGRASVVRIEPAGTAELRRLGELNRDRFARVLADWDPADLGALTDLLTRLRTSIGGASTRERAAQRSRAARAAGEPPWLADWLAG